MKNLVMKIISLKGKTQSELKIELNKILNDFKFTKKK